MRLSSIPWWGWAIVAFVLFNVVLNQNLNIVPLLLIGVFVAALMGGGSQGRPRSLPDGRGRIASSAPAQDDHPGGQAQVGPAPAGQGYDAHGDTPMPRIEVPSFPGGDGGPGGGSSSAGPPPSADLAGDPVISLAQLNISRYARELDAAASAERPDEVRRLLGQLREQAERTTGDLASSSGSSGSGRRTFVAGLRQLQKDAGAAASEDPPGREVARVVRGAGALGQTGRYE
ncbi:hypothetical protein [Ornithinimicrobium sp. Y1694]|uniref:hypothetical protein n=1 Tax=Ornithinimicrobium sp. Y1694 TaxID=3418590 RepID=UPI003CE863F3